MGPKILGKLSPLPAKISPNLSERLCAFKIEEIVWISWTLDINDPSLKITFVSNLESLVINLSIVTVKLASLGKTVIDSGKL